MILVPAAIARADNTQTRGHSVVLGLDERDVVPLEHDPAQGLLGVPLQVHLGRVVQHQVHVLVETHDVSLDPEEEGENLVERGVSNVKMRYVNLMKSHKRYLYNTG